MAEQLDPELLYRMRFIHPEKTLADMPGVDSRVVARLFSISRRTYRRAIRWFEEGVTAESHRLLEDEHFVSLLDRSGLADARTVVGMGDSITDDYQSWFEILRRVCIERFGEGGPELLNLGISGETTTAMVSRTLSVVQARPDLVLCLAGTNDARRHGPQAHTTLVSLDETRRNYRALERVFGDLCHARSVWITPPPVVEDRITSHWFLSPFEISWKNEDLAARAGLLQDLGFAIADVRESFGLPADPELLLPDGLHPALTGHAVIAHAVVGALAS